MHQHRSKLLLAIGALLLSAVVAPVMAEVIDYDPRRAPALLACDDHMNRGRIGPAEQCYGALLKNNDPLIRAEAYWALGNVKEANDHFREATRLNANSSHVRVRWGRLYLSTHQYGDALALFVEAEKLDPKDEQARVGRLRLLAERFEGEARGLADRLRKEDDSLVEVHLISGRMDLEEGHLREAERSLKRALSLLERQKRAPLEAYSLLAALELMRGNDTPQEWIDRALKYNPRYGGVFEMLAHYEVMRRRYREANAWLQRAVEVQPNRWSAQAELGANLMRLGDMDTARKHLEFAYSGDPYSATTVNTLRLLDSLKNFDTERVSQPDIVMKLHRDESKTLSPYVERLVRESIRQFSSRYGYEPREPIIVELYPNHDDFGVRTAGLPGIGLLGVTFGHVVAMDSPSGRRSGDFHWGSTLWHEMAHVFTLSVTGHRVPRWLAEGISMFEEWRTGPTPGVVISPIVLAAFKEDKFLPVATLDEGFIRPEYPNQVQVSYLQSGLICLFIEERWGFPKLVELLHQFKRETTTQQAVEATFGISSAEFDKQFNEFMKKRFGTAIDRMDEWRNLMRAAHEASEGEHWAAVIGPARQAVRIFPEYTTSDSAHLLLANALDKTGSRKEALDVLLRYRELGGWDPAALRKLAQWLDEAGRKDESTEVLMALNYADPFNGAQHAQLGERLLAANKAEEALREYRVLLALAPQDGAVANFGIARALRSMGEQDGSRRHLLDALETAPHYRPAQDLLLEMVGDKHNE